MQCPLWISHTKLFFASAIRCGQRGSTLTGYSLVTAMFVVVSLGAIKGLNDSSGAFLTGTGSKIGDPRSSAFELTDGATGGVAPTGTPNPFNPTPGPTPVGNTAPPILPYPHGPTTNINFQSGYPNAFPDLDTTGGNSPYRSDTAAFVFDEGGRPAAALDAFPNPTAVPIGANVCSYYLHFTPENNGTLGPIEIQLPGPVIGFAATDVDLDATDRWIDPLAANPPAEYRGSRAFEANEISAIQVNGAALSVASLYAVNDNADDVRIFFNC